MIPGDHIILNGKLVSTDKCSREFAWLMRSNYTYRKLHAIAYKPLHLQTQLKLLSLSYSALFGRELHFGQVLLEQSIYDLLYRSNAPSGSNLVKIVAAPCPKTSETRIFIFYEGPMVYPGYCIWHKPVSAYPLTFEIPFPVFRTSANLICHDYARSHANSKGFDEALTVNYKGDAVSVGENPLFVITGRNVYVPDAETDCPQSVERLLGVELCTKAGLTVTEKALPLEKLDSADELFAFTPQGILPIGAVSKKLFASTLVKTFDDILPALASQEFLYKD